METQILEILQKTLNKLGIHEEVELVPTKNYGDYSTNIALKVAKALGRSPLDVANEIVSHIDSDLFIKVEVAQPGFINLFLSPLAIAEILQQIINEDHNFGRGKEGKKINLEYVSANPTGFLHLGHARGAALGSSLANILKYAGNKVDQEYYVNDAGNQIEILGISVWTRYQNLLGVEHELPEESYRGDDIFEVAKQFIVQVGEKYKNVPYESVKEEFKEFSKHAFLEIIKDQLASFETVFDIYTSERELLQNDKIRPSIEKLKEHVYIQDGATWLRTTNLGDDKDRVLIKADGNYTYFTPDIAYHNEKLSRGYDSLINIWGADHIGYIKRMEVAINYLGLPSDQLDILVVQLVKLVKDGEELKMSKRKGTTYTLQDLIELVGKDAARFHLINRSNTSSFDFDIDLANAQSNDNPVFTVQYTHARAFNLLKNSQKFPAAGEYLEDESRLIIKLNEFSSLIKLISKNHKVHLLPQYLIDVASAYNSIYSTRRIIGEDREVVLLALTYAVKIILRNGLQLIGVTAPESM